MKHTIKAVMLGISALAVPAFSQEFSVNLDDPRYAAEAPAVQAPEVHLAKDIGRDQAGGRAGAACPAVEEGGQGQDFGLLAVAAGAVKEDQAALLDKELPEDFFCPSFSRKARFDWDTRTYSHVNSALLSELAFLSYYKRADFNTRLKEWAGGAGALRTEVLADADTDTQAYVAWNESAGNNGFVIISFRGTSSKRDMLSDVRFIKRGGCGKIWGDVHRGFKKSYEAIRGQLLGRLESIGGTCVRNNAEHPVLAGCVPARKVIVVGHSLGGALATIFAADVTTAEIAENNKDKGDKLLVHSEESGDKSMSCELLADPGAAANAGLVRPGLIHSLYTYGSPRVGNRYFSKCFSAALGSSSFRVSYRDDIVSRVPNVRYLHVGDYYHFYRKGAKESVLYENPVSDQQRQGAAFNPLGELLAIANEARMTISHFLANRTEVAVSDHLAYPYVLRRNVDGNCQFKK